jgi:hypothetical protein
MLFLELTYFIGDVVDLFQLTSGWFLFTDSNE